MAAANAYRIKSATFGTAILGITDFSVGSSGSSTEHGTDASPTVTAIFVDSIITAVSLTTTDINRCTTILAGSTGSLVLVFQLRAEGSGAGAGDKTVTMSNAVVESCTPQAGTNGVGSVSISWKCSGPGNTATQVWS